MNYAWVITKDCLDCGCLGIVGPSGCPNDLADSWGLKIRQDKRTQEFRVLDSDGEVYYYGLMLDPDGNASGFEPLEDYGCSLGAVDIQYKNDSGEYVTL